MERDCFIGYAEWCWVSVGLVNSCVISRRCTSPSSRACTPLACPPMGGAWDDVIRGKPTLQHCEKHGSGLARDAVGRA